MRTKRQIVITTVHPATKAVNAFAGISDHQLVVVGDLKTPSGWSCPGAVYLSASDPGAAEFLLSRKLPFNHYSRKMLGYLHAIRNGAETIIDTDDDNIPNPDWGFPAFKGAFPATGPNRGFINIYSYYTSARIWPRGLPLELINDSGTAIGPADVSLRQSDVAIWQGLADGEPDTDAVYRLVDNATCIFRRMGPLVLSPGTVSPFNSQNTAFHLDAFPLLYLPTTVTFRFTDILRGLVAQPILWAHRLSLGFHDATVLQDRNPHDYMQDFIQEIPMYLHAYRVLDIATSAVGSGGSMADNLHNVYDGLCRCGIVESREMKTVAAWLSDLETLNVAR